MNQDMIRVPVFVVNGFLESGKTSFIKNALLKDPQTESERVAIICCEEGIEEYDDLPDNIHVCMIEEKQELTPDFLLDIKATCRPTYVIIEFNPLWGSELLDKLYLPFDWGWAEQLSIIDAQTFGSYFANMKSIFADMLRLSSRIFFKRCPENGDLKALRDAVRPMNPRGNIIFINDEKGALNITFEDELPYDVNAPMIKLNEETYPVWFIDMIDNIDRYEGKKIECTLTVQKPDFFRDGYFYGGNKVMTCCEDDMQFWGFVCRYEKTGFLKVGKRIRIEATVHTEFSPEYEEDGPVLYVSKVTTMPS